MEDCGEIAIRKIGGLELPGPQILALEALPRDAVRVVFLAGSLVEGFGNPWSDIDCYVIGDAEPIGPHVFQESQCKLSIHLAGRDRVDYEFWAWEEVSRIGEKLQSFDPFTWRDADLLSQSQQAIAHRVRHAYVLAGDIAEATAAIDPHRLSLMQSCSAVRRLDGIFEDICGMVEGNDLVSGLALSRQLLDLSMDAYLHSLGRTNPSGKWRLRMLEAFPVDEALKQRWLSLYYPPPDLKDNEAAAREFIVRTLKCSEQIIAKVL